MARLDKTQIHNLSWNIYESKNFNIDNPVLRDCVVADKWKVVRAALAIAEYDR